MKKHLLKIAVILCFVISISKANAQNIFPSTGAAGIGTTTPNTSSLLEIKSTTKGLLIPRMTFAQRNAIVTPATGLLIYQTNSTPGFVYYNGSVWKPVSAKAWSLTGNAGTNPSTNFIGTTDAQPLKFRVNNTSAGFIDNSTFNTGTRNTAFGLISLYSNTSGLENTAIGYGTLYSNQSGNDNSAFGKYALFTNTQGSYNIALGYNALYFNTTGDHNTATGSVALQNNTTSSNNTANGYAALYSNNGGTENSGFGVSSLYANVSGNDNTAAGYAALNSNTANDNTATGAYALYLNTSGANNSAIGLEALYQNTTGSNNTASGLGALTFNGSGNNNTANGYKALYNNTASDNTATGYAALYSNTSGNVNTATGNQALYSNIIGYANTAYGEEALYKNTTGSYNTALGRYAGNFNQTGDYNTYIGFGTNTNSDNNTNSTAVGENSVITATEQMRFGNISVLSIGGYSNWTNISDGRVKKNIKQNVPGLAFINKLQPITYNLNLDAADKIIQRPIIKDKSGKTMQPSQFELDARKVKEQIVYTGFIAQDVEKAAKSLNYDFSGVDAAKNDKDLYGLRYSDFVVPLVKAVQELSKMNNTKDSAIRQQNTKIDDLQNQINQLKAMIVSSAGSYQSILVSSTSLQQNAPNPFTSTTSIGYTLPQKYSSAQIVITDKSGKTLKAVNVSGNGKGLLNVSASTLASGAYQYSLIVDGKLIATKQMVLQK